jgi:phosphinothricin acetyltransferase
MNANDWTQVQSIYQKGISTGHATFEAKVPEWQIWDSNHMTECRLVARSDQNILGWAALSPANSRCIYSGVAEVSVYVDPQYQRKGVGANLLAALIKFSEKKGIWTLQAGIFPENQASLELHKRHGFREVGRREKLGKMTFGPLLECWRDVLLLERRSKSIGID